MAKTLKIEVPEFNFDVIQGQDLELPMRYEVDGVADTVAGASLKMQLRTVNFSSVLDTLSTANTRIVITGANTFSVFFPSATTSGYVIQGGELKAIYGLELTDSLGKIKRLIEGTITVKREQTI